jgi:UDP-N-acetylmuramoyl-L-alanyl-D-glutamate--2,6-diaminopimelate ligase
VRAKELFGPPAEAGRVKVYGNVSREITGLTTDSRFLERGDLFAAFSGPHGDGHAHLLSAIEGGASALLVREGLWDRSAVHGSIAVIESGDVRAAYAEAADRYYGHPSGEMDLFGITGTNGKTSVTHLLEALFREAGVKAGVVGTIEYRWDGRREKAPCTTPEAGDLQRLLGQMVSDGVRTVAIEVSSHALVQQRVRGCSFRTAIFTNLGRDHLDFHCDMEDYFSAKASLFRDYRPETALINVDDPWGRRIVGEVPGVRSYGLAEGADYTAGEVTSDASGIRFVLRTPGFEVELSSRLLGVYNVYNILAAAAAASDYGLSPEEIKRGVAMADPVPGRFERVSGEGETTVLVDYAHTPDALASALRAARMLAGQRLILVFGCGGDRDQGKRPLMGGVAARLADLVFLTSDNPRSENPDDIVEQIAEGCRAHGGTAERIRIVPDRKEAIYEAVSEAGPGDVVLVAGKGHEDTQTSREGTMPFSDRDEVRNALRDAGK